MSVRLPVRDKHGATVAHALVDEADAPRLVSARWHFRNAEGYLATRLPGGVVEALHRVVMGCTPGDGLVVDHVNGDRLDNRRENLRFVTTAQNAQNQGSRGGSSRYRGVTWDRARGRWLAQACLDGRVHHLGRFESEVAAASAATEFRAVHMPYSEEARRAA